jgi:hypothetical protein
VIAAVISVVAIITWNPIDVIADFSTVTAVVGAFVAVASAAAW